MQCLEHADTAGLLRGKQLAQAEAEFAALSDWVKDELKERGSGDNATPGQVA